MALLFPGFHFFGDINLHNCTRGGLALKKVMLLILLFVLTNYIVMAGVKELREKATNGVIFSGDAEAQYALGIRYLTGNEVVKDIDEAIKWLEYAAKQKHAGAFYKLGEIYFKYGNFVEADKNYRRAADYGYGQVAVEKCRLAMGLQSLVEKATQNPSDVEAQETIGMHLLTNPETLETGVEWLKKAANQGSVNAQYQLGSLFLENDEVNEAIKWLELAATHNHSEAQLKLSLCYFKSNSQELSGDAYKWLTTSAKNGNLEAQKILGKALAESGSKDAIPVLIQAAEQNDPDTQALLGNLYLEGQLVEKNFSEAKKWLQKAASGKNIEAQTKLGSILLEENDPAAIQWLGEAAASDNAEAQYLLGLIFFEGKGVAPNLDEAEKWLLKAKDKNFEKAKTLLLSLETKRKEGQISWFNYFILFALIGTFLFYFPSFYSWLKYVLTSFKIWNYAQVAQIPSLWLSVSATSQFEQFEIGVNKIKTFSSTNQAVVGGVRHITTQLNSMLRNFAKLVIKETSLVHQINSLGSQELLNRKITETKATIAQTKDAIAKSQLEKKLELIRLQTIKFEELLAFQERLSTQRANLLEELNSIYANLSSIEFSDLKNSSLLKDTLESSLNNINLTISDVETALAKVLTSSPKIEP